MLSTIVLNSLLLWFLAFEPIVIINTYSDLRINMRLFNALKYLYPGESPGLWTKILPLHEYIAILEG